MDNYFARRNLHPNHNDKVQLRRMYAGPLGYSALAAWWGGLPLLAAPCQRPSLSTSESSAGRVVLGQPTYMQKGRVVFYTENHEKSLSVEGQEEGDRFGEAVLEVADVDSDGVPDYVVSAPGVDSKVGLDVGCVYLVSGRDGTIIDRHVGNVSREQLGVHCSTDGASVIASGVNGHDGTFVHIDDGVLRRASYSVGLGTIKGLVVAGSSLFFVAVQEPEDGDVRIYRCGEAQCTLLGVIANQCEQDVSVEIGYLAASNEIVSGICGSSPSSIGKVNVWGADALSAGTALEPIRGARPPYGFGRSVVVVPDIDGDGRRDIGVGIVDSVEGRSAFYSSASKKLIRQTALGGELTLLADIDGDGVRDYLAGSTIVSAKSGTAIMQVELVRERSISDVQAMIGPDGKVLVVVGRPMLGGLLQGEVRLVNMDDGKTRWSQGLGEMPGAEFGQRLCVTSDVDGDGFSDVLATVQLPQPRLLCLSGASGDVIKAITLGEDRYGRWELASVGDGDGHLAVVGMPTERGARGVAFVVDLISESIERVLRPDNESFGFGSRVEILRTAGERARFVAAVGGLTYSGRRPGYLFDVESGVMLGTLLCSELATTELSAGYTICSVADASGESAVLISGYSSARRPVGDSQQHAALLGGTLGATCETWQGLGLAAVAVLERAAASDRVVFLDLVGEKFRLSANDLLVEDRVLWTFTRKWMAADSLSPHLLQPVVRSISDLNDEGVEDLVVAAQGVLYVVAGESGRILKQIGL